SAPPHGGSRPRTGGVLVKPVNLLPQSARPYVASGGRSTSSYALLGALALLVVAAVVYVSSANTITTRIATVAQLAVGRIDYERLMRETALVLPSGVWLDALDAEAGTGTSTSTPATPGTATGAGAPT